MNKEMEAARAREIAEDILTKGTLSVAGMISCIIDGEHRMAFTPQTACSFWQRFDAGKPVKPFSFNLKI